MSDPEIKLEITYNKETSYLHAKWTDGTPITLIQMIVDELRRVVSEQRQMLMAQHMLQQAQAQSQIVDFMGKQLKSKPQ